MQAANSVICEPKFIGIAENLELVYHQHDFIPMTWTEPRKRHTFYPLRAMICSRCGVETNERVV